ncbi:hypothetical protein A9404_12100 [Halothiobacillus diazotrophicus]|uniref:Uncharacterized protein n=2 Tax=Halothiobacillus diazotrophicus TaxID=1860122 RepID=A0A191ZJH2_9GAMM|nr:hypothetical protein A9404_12100 [Halothiobacillus diazotrophicus]
MTMHRFGVFETPLIPIGGSPASQENRELRSAIEAYRTSGDAEQLAPIDHFLQSHPQSPWRTALLVNEGLAYAHAGMFSNAIDKLQTVWNTRANLTLRTEAQQALIQKVYGKLLWLHTVLGHAEAVKTLLSEGKGMVLTGAAQAQKTQAEEGLWRMEHEPAHARICGLVALEQLMKKQGDVQGIARIAHDKAGPKGIDLSQLEALSDDAGLNARVIFRHRAAPIPVPSVVHWKVGHYATIVGESGGRYHIKDAAIGRDYWMTQAAIRSESSGYFLVPDSTLAKGKQSWRTVATAEAERVYGAGITPGNNPNDTSSGDPGVGGGSPPPSCGGGGGGGSPLGMPQYTVKAMLVSLSVQDTPLAYTPPKGPAVPVSIIYSQREANQPANFTFGNLGQKWVSNWISYVQDDPNAPGSNVTIALRGGGTRTYGGYNASTGAFAPEERTGAHLVQVSSNPATYERRMPDGSKDVYGASDGSAYFPRRVFLTQVVDPSGNAVTLNYDSQMRLTTLTDALGQKTTFQYGDSQYPLQMTGVTGPFGRTVAISYDDQGRLIGITDAIGMHSSFTYDSGTFMTAMTTPYGTTQFDGGQNGTTRWLDITDPQGQKERVEFRHNAPGIPFSDSPVPQGINTFNAYINSRDTFYWDKTAMQRAPGDYTQAQIFHWLHKVDAPYYGYTSGALESIKEPLEHRIWFNYPNQSWAGGNGGLDKPSAIARVLADGSTQLQRFSYNTYGRTTQSIDPVGRTLNYTYAADGIDLIQVARKTASGEDILARLTYNGQHEPLTYTDAAGQTTTYTYNGAGQRTSMTDPVGDTTTYAYDPNGYLVSVTNANGKIADRYTYDGYGRLASSTDSEGHTLRYSYDALNRETAVTYPDGTSRTITWNNLDPVATTDREGRTTQYAYDSVRDLISKTDPMGQVTRYGYFANGNLQSLTDPNGNTTRWDRDIEGRVTDRTYADGSQVHYAYDITGHLINRTDALGQSTNYSYAHDNRLAGISYTNAIHATAPVQFGYDSYYPRLTSRVDAQGTTTYAYYPAGVLGAGQLESEQGQNAHDLIQYTYNALGLQASRTVDGATETYGYDDLGRLIGDSNPLGAFTFGYLGETDQPVQQTIQYDGKLVPYQVRYEYENNLGDRRLKAILNDVLHRGRPKPVADFWLQTSPDGLIQSRREMVGGLGDIQRLSAAERFGRHWGLPDWMFGDHHDQKQSHDRNDDNEEDDHAHHEHDLAFKPGAIVNHYRYDNALRLTQVKGRNPARYTYDAAGNITGIATGRTVSTAFTVNALNQIQTDGKTDYQYDANGNLLSDGTHSYQWDAADRLIEITNKQTGHTSQFAYDGLNRRASDTETDRGGSPVTTKFLWCGERICEKRDSSDTVQARYYNEGELHGDQPLYYVQDEVGSVVALVNNEGQVVGRLSYDSYGKIIQHQGTLPDYQYAGLYAQTESGLYLATYRAYDPDTSRWLSRDPIREIGGINLYTYVGNDPVGYIDELGLCKDDVCKKIEDKINKVRNELAKRADELHRNPLDLPPSGPMSIAGHQQQFRNKQTQLRNLLNDYDSQGCNGGLPADAWSLASMPTPSSDANNQNFMQHMREITGLTGEALVTYIIISEGSRVFLPRNFVPLP